MFSINGFNYVIDTNRVPHAIIGNNNVSPLSTDVTVAERHASAEHDLHAQRADLRLRRGHLSTTCSRSPGRSSIRSRSRRSRSSSIRAWSSRSARRRPPPGDYAGNGCADRHGHCGFDRSDRLGDHGLNLYAGTERVRRSPTTSCTRTCLYTLIKSAGVYTAVQKTYTVYASHPLRRSSSSAVFDLGGTTYMVTDGTTAGATPAAGHQPRDDVGADGDPPARDAVRAGLRLRAQPTNVTSSRPTTDDFQFSRREHDDSARPDHAVQHPLHGGQRRRTWCRSTSPTCSRRSRRSRRSTSTPAPR